MAHRTRLGSRLARPGQQQPANLQPNASGKLGRNTTDTQTSDHKAAKTRENKLNERSIAPAAKQQLLARHSGVHAPLMLGPPPWSAVVYCCFAHRNGRACSAGALPAAMGGHAVLVRGPKQADHNAAAATITYDKHQHTTDDHQGRLATNRPNPTTATGNKPAKDTRPWRRVQHQHSTPYHGGGHSTSTARATTAADQAPAEHVTPEPRASWRK